jgi:hypothetical protein
MARCQGRANDECALRRTILMLVTAALFAVFAQSALAAGGSYTFAGGTVTRQSTVRAALNASSFDWGVLPRSVTVHIGPIGGSYSQVGDVYLDGSLLDSGRFSWGVVQHEFAHQVDFMLFDDTKRELLGSALGGKDWCYSVPGLDHWEYGCERFASELAWAYWPSADNTMSPAYTHGESGGMPITQFRALVAQLLGVPSLARLTPVKAFAPTPTARPKKHR